MTDLRKMSLFRDVQVALDFQQMAKEGYVDTEFTMYGTLYFDENMRQYMTSANASRIIDFIDADIDAGWCCLPMRTLTDTRHVPMGEREKIAESVKLDLARSLQKDYPESFMKNLTALAQAEGTNQALPLLKTLCKKTANTFDADKLDALEELVRLAYRRKSLKKASYQAFKEWFARERENLADDIIPKDILSKTWYSFSFEDRPGHRKQLTNARKEWIYHKKIEQETKGIATSPIYAHTYWYNNQNGLDETKEKHQALCKRILDDDYWQAVVEIAGYPGFIDAAEWQALEKETVAAYGEKAAQALAYFKNIWRIH